MDISIYFEPVAESLFNELAGGAHPRLGQILNVFREENVFPELEGVQIALLGVNDDRGAVDNEGCSGAANEVRHYLYRLFPGAWTANIADLGNIRRGHSVEDTYFAVSSTLEWLISNRIFPVILGGGHDMTFAMYKAYEKLEQIINMAVVDPMFDLGEKRRCSSFVATGASLLHKCLVICHS